MYYTSKTNMQIFTCFLHYHITPSVLRFVFLCIRLKMSCLSECCDLIVGLLMIPAIPVLDIVDNFWDIALLPPDEIIDQAFLEIDDDGDDFL